MLNIYSKQQLTNLYVEQKLSIHKIGEILNVSGSTVSRWLKKFNIQIRNDPKRFDSLRFLSDLQKEFIIGSLLGDGNLDYHSGKRLTTCRLRFCHGIKQIDYVIWKKELLGQLVQQDLNINRQKTRNSTACVMQTINHPEFIKYYNMFYDNEKVVPKNISEYLTPFGLAVWFMDDGWRDPLYRKAIFCTDSFTLEDNELLKNVLSEKFNINANVTKNGDKHFRLHLYKDNVDKLNEIIKPYIIPSMLYKINDDIVRTT